MASTGNRASRRVLIIVENLPVPFDRRVWQEAVTLQKNGYEVSVICPKAEGYKLGFEVIDGVHIFRHPLPFEARGAVGYVLEYSAALVWQFALSWLVLARRGFDVIHACNPPDTIFLVGGFFKLILGKKFLFDHHDLNPELYVAKFGRRDLFHKLLRKFEYWTFRTADVSIATNESYRRIAIERGKMAPASVHVVRSGPALDRMKILPAIEALKNGRRYLVGYVGVMGNQEGIGYLLRAAQHIIYKLGRKDVQFGFVGSGPEFGQLKREAAALGVEEYVTFYGRVPDQELLEVLNTADVCVNPDEYNDMNDKSTMNKVMEYMALAKPMVQFDMTEGRYSAQHASIYAKPNDSVDLADKIVTLLDDPERRERMGQFGRERVANELAWSHQATKLLKAYESLWD